MSVTSVDKDFENRTLTLVADFDATVARVWQLWADPRRLEQWWGPPTYPATVEEHDLTPGGNVTYFMTSPEGHKHRGWWRVVSADPPTSLEFVNGFAKPDGTPAVDLPTPTMRVEITEHGASTRMVVRTSFDSAEDMERMVEMGMAEGLAAAVGQIDTLLTEET